MGEGRHASCECKSIGMSVLRKPSYLSCILEHHGRAKIMFMTHACVNSENEDNINISARVSNVHTLV